MGKYDLLVKDLMRQRPPNLMLRMGVPDDAVKTDSEVSSKEFERFGDYLAVDTSGHFYHVEFQTYNDPQMPFRMLEYFTLITRNHLTELNAKRKKAEKRDRPSPIASQALVCKMSILQTVVHLVNYDAEPAQILHQGSLMYSYREEYASTFPAAEFLDSMDSADVVFAILCEFNNVETAPERVLKRLGELMNKTTNRYLECCSDIFVLAGLRGIQPEVVTEFGKLGLIVNVARDEKTASQIVRGIQELNNSIREDLVPHAMSLLPDDIDPEDLATIELFIANCSAKTLALAIRQGATASDWLQMATANAEEYAATPSPSFTRGR